jgi:hypothetical protein
MVKIDDCTSATLKGTVLWIHNKQNKDLV